MTSFIATPPFFDYVSAHSTFSGAAVTALALCYSIDEVPFTTGSDFLPGLTRAISEAIISNRNHEWTPGDQPTTFGTPGEYSEDVA